MNPDPKRLKFGYGTGNDHGFSYLPPRKPVILKMAFTSGVSYPPKLGPPLNWGSIFHASAATMMREAKSIVV